MILFKCIPFFIVALLFAFSRWFKFFNNDFVLLFGNCKYFIENSYLGKYIPRKIDRNLTFTFPKQGNCTYCNFTVRNQEYADSSEKDIIILGALEKIENLSPFMRSLRTTGSKCSVVLLTDDASYIDEVTLQSALDCGLQIIRCGHDLAPDFPYGPHNFIYYLIKEFLEQNKGKFDRVITIDLYDVIFQGDPFNVQVGRDFINAIDEGARFIDSRTNRNWWPKYKPPLKSSELQNYYVCSGYFAGSQEMMTRFIDLFIENTDLETGTADQGTFNYIVLREMEKANLTKNPFREKELVYNTLGLNLFFERYAYKQMGNIRTVRSHDAFASIVHRYYTSGVMTKSILKACPRISKTQINYLAKCNDACIKKLEK